MNALIDGSSCFDAPVLVASTTRAVILSEAGEIEETDFVTVRKRWNAGMVPLVCHAPAVRRRTGARNRRAFDLLELLAFVRPAVFVTPTVGGIARLFGLQDPDDLVAQAQILQSAMTILLDELPSSVSSPRQKPDDIAVSMLNSGWIWAPDVVRALGNIDDASASLNVWEQIEPWEETGPRSSKGTHGISPDAVIDRLNEMLGDSAESRPGQFEFAKSLVPAFQPRDNEETIHSVQAEAGTGIGKTAGYIAPASLWSEANNSSVWISTFTRNLQHQIDQELDRLDYHHKAKRDRIVLRKGRGNYLCLLNFQNQASYANFATSPLLGLIARWIQFTRDGDMTGGDLPGWLHEIFGRANTMALADHRGECIYSACPHYRRCFIESTVRRSRLADIVVSNHALSLLSIMHAADGDPLLPTRFIFDEGHHLFSVVDNTFARRLTLSETADLRRWLTGGQRSRNAIDRLTGLIGDEAFSVARELTVAATVLPDTGWHDRMQRGSPRGPTEAFFARIRQQVRARASQADGYYTIECDTHPLADGVIESADALQAVLKELLQPIRELVRHMKQELSENTAVLEPETRVRLESAIVGLELRASVVVEDWISMLDGLHHGTPDTFVDWFSVERKEGRDSDAGMHRHWVDPGAPFAAALAKSVHGMVVTSATLRDSAEADDANDMGWDTAGLRTGLRHLATPPQSGSFESPFAYDQLTRFLIVTDVPRNDAEQVAAAFRELFIAAGGGALGIFNAIKRLKDIHRRVAPALEAAGLQLYAQHVDAMDTGTLVDIFRSERNACLLGTDAVRDGIDVPGPSLRLIVLERVPWHRRNILHRTRMERFSDLNWDDFETRLRIRQAFGRLVRKSDDRGVFVLLDRQTPSRMLDAIPPGVPVDRTGLRETIEIVRSHLGTSTIVNTNKQAMIAQH